MSISQITIRVSHSYDGVKIFGCEAPDNRWHFAEPSSNEDWSNLLFHVLHSKQNSQCTPGSRFACEAINKMSGIVRVPSMWANIVDTRIQLNILKSPTETNREDIIQRIRRRHRTLLWYLLWCASLSDIFICDLPVPSTNRVQKKRILDYLY